MRTRAILSKLLIFLMACSLTNVPYHTADLSRSLTGYRRSLANVLLTNELQVSSKATSVS